MTTELALILAALAIFVIARMVHPGKDQFGTQLHGPKIAVFDKDILRVASFNVQTGKSLEGQRDIQRAADVLENSDIAGVQEVYGMGWLAKFGFGQSQSEALAGGSGFQYLFAATRYRWFREQRGNLLLSKLPIREWRIKMLPDQSRKSPRNMTIAEFEWQGQTIVIINTHLHTGRGREQQLNAVIKEFAKYPIAILLGDFNTKRESELIQALIADPQITDAIDTAGLDHENAHRIDWIFTKGFKVLNGSMLEKGVSDHPYYQVELTLEDRK